MKAGRWDVAVLLLCSCLQVACGERSRSGAAHRAEARDSAGVTIYTLAGEPVRTTNLLVQTVEIDDQNLHLVESADTDEDRTVVASRGTHEVVILDLHGRRLRSFGRAGSGPGEFAQLGSAIFADDGGVIAYDFRHLRATYFDSAGGAARDLRVTYPDTAASYGLSNLLGTVDSGSSLVFWSQTRRTVPGAPLQPGSVPIVVFVTGRTGELTSEIGVFPGEEVFLGPLPNTPNRGPLPFGSWSRFGVARDRVYVVRNVHGDVLVHRPRGDLEAIYQVDWVRKRVSERNRELQIQVWIARSPLSGTPAERRREFEQAPYPQEMPYFKDAVVGADGSIWLEPYSLWEPGKRTFIGYDTAGVALHRLILAPSDKLLHITRETVVLVRRSSEDVQQVLRFPLRTD